MVVIVPQLSVKGCARQEDLGITALPGVDVINSRMLARHEERENSVTLLSTKVGDNQEPIGIGMGRTWSKAAVASLTEFR